MKSKRVFLAAACLITVLACSRPGNYERAYFTKSGRSYLVELKGTRRLMAHDPISGIRGKTYEETLTLQLPRIEGEIEGSEIEVAPGKLSYHGNVVITKDKMTVNLYYNDDEKRPLDWNGHYTLVSRD
jgi:hypothetical protein